MQRLPEELLVMCVTGGECSVEDLATQRLVSRDWRDRVERGPVLRWVKALPVGACFAQSAKAGLHCLRFCVNGRGISRDVFHAAFLFGLSCGHVAI